jgi:hypothetical protein
MCSVLTPHPLAVTLIPREAPKLYPSNTESDSFSIASPADMSGKKAVSFGLIHVREYDRVVGDNPSVKFGPPISIGWDFVQKQALPIDVYESTKLPRKEEDLHMSSIDRRRMRRYGFGVSWAEIRAAEEEEEFRKIRHDVYESTELPRYEDLRMSSVDRRRMLRYGFDVSWAEIREAEEEVQKIRKERVQTIYQGKAGRATEKVTQPAKRILKRTTAWFLPSRRKV